MYCTEIWYYAANFRVYTTLSYEYFVKFAKFGFTPKCHTKFMKTVTKI